MYRLATSYYTILLTYFDIRLESKQIVSTSSKDDATVSLDPITSLPNEVVFHIFSFISGYDLIHNCQIVSKKWRSCIDDPYLWQLKISLAGIQNSRLFELDLKVNWPKFYMKVICRDNFLNNFDQNHRLSLSPWTIIKNGGDQWRVEDGCIRNEEEQLIKENGGSQSNYVTSHGNCSRRQIVDLMNAGVDPEILDKLQPTIEVAEWYAARWDCGSTYWVCVSLLNDKKEKITEHSYTDTTPQWVGGQKGWCRFSHNFCSYGPGVRYVEFWDKGKDTQFWAGHYGSKMAGATVKIVF